MRQALIVSINNQSNTNQNYFPKIVIYGLLKMQEKWNGSRENKGIYLVLNLFFHSTQLEIPCQPELLEPKPQFKHLPLILNLTLQALDFSLPV